MVFKNEEIRSVQILDRELQPAGCTLQAAQLLFDHWQAVFCEKEVDLEVADHNTGNYI